MNVDLAPIVVILLPIVSIQGVHIRWILKFLQRAQANQILIEKIVSSSQFQFEIPNKCNCKKGYLAYFLSGFQNQPVATAFGPVLTTNMPDKVCRDIDECSDGTHTCDEHSTCYNKDGKYRCQCNS